MQTAAAVSNALPIRICKANRQEDLMQHTKPKKALEKGKSITSLWEERNRLRAEASKVAEKSEVIWEKMPREARRELSVHKDLPKKEREKIKAIQDAFGFTPYHEQEEALWDEAFRIDDKIMAMVATSPEDLMPQIILAMERFGYDTLEFQADTSCQTIKKSLSNLQLKRTAPKKGLKQKSKLLTHLERIPAVAGYTAIDVGSGNASLLCLNKGSYIETICGGTGRVWRIPTQEFNAIFGF